MDTSYTMRPATPEDIPAILALMDVGLGSAATIRRTEDFWRWKHVAQPFGESIVWVAESGHRLVGLRAFMRWAFQSRSASSGDIMTWQAVRAVDTVTHPDFRRKGIFWNLNEQALGTAKEQGIDFVFNTPNPQSAAGYLKQGWQSVDVLPLALRPLRPFQMLALVLNRVRGRGRVASQQWLLEDIAPVHSEDTALFEVFAERAKARVGNQLETCASASYYQWRYAAHPNVRYYKVFLNGEPCCIVRPNIRFGVKEVVICDIYLDKGSSLKNQVEELNHMLRQNGAAYSILHSHDTHLQELKKAGGFIKIPNGIQLLVRPLSAKAQAANLLDIQQWALGMGTLETF